MSYHVMQMNPGTFSTTLVYVPHGMVATPHGDLLEVFVTNVEYSVEAGTKSKHCDLKAPILHVFGSTRSGVRCCVHVHNVLPYCYVEYKGRVEETVVSAYVANLEKALNSALALTLPPMQMQPQHQLIAKIQLCQGTPFYGYHDRSAYFFKIAYTDPALRTRIASVLEQGRVMHTPFQLFEAHVSYPLQWMMDYNVNGCDWLRMTKPVYRGKGDLPSKSYCALEVDISAEQILNRLDVRPSDPLASQPSASIQEHPVVPSLRALWAQDRDRRMHYDLGATPTLSSGERSVDASQKVWDASERLWKMWNDRIDQMKDEQMPHRLVKMRVPTAYETVENGDDWSESGRETICVAEPVQSLTQMPRSVRSHGSSNSRSLPELNAFVPSVPKPRDSKRLRSSSPCKSPSLSVPGSRWYVWKAPPLQAELNAAWFKYGLPRIPPVSCHYSNTKDVPQHSHTYSNYTKELKSSSLDGLEPFCGYSSHLSRQVCVQHWQWAPLPPSQSQVRAWLAGASTGAGAGAGAMKQSRPTPLQAEALSCASCGESQHVSVEKKYMSTMCIEILAHTRGDLVPDARHDALTAVVYTWMEEADENARDMYVRRSGAILVRDVAQLGLQMPVALVPSERALIEQLIEYVRTWDPDILAGYDLHRSSWAFLASRANALDIDLPQELGRLCVSSQKHVTPWMAARTSSLHVCGRHVLNVWSLMSSHVALTDYSLEHVVLHVLHKRTPRYEWSCLTAWMEGRATDMARAVRYVHRRVDACAQLLEKTEILFRTAEFARMYGIDFFSVLSRGSQFRVESVLLRITKPRSYLLPSPNRTQVAQQNAPECIPLILEPHARMYSSPVIVLDFQSLYPSIIMAYNICYSTCVGRIAPFKGAYKLGFTEHVVPASTLHALRHNVYILPNGMVFVKPHVREGILPRMLREVLSARVMTKHALKAMPMHRTMQRRLQAQQLALKLLANVTYGYCGASMSGRMPCVEMADAIVQAARETLEQAMSTVEHTPKWGADIVYGDTDSMFVCVRGQSKSDAFRVGAEIAERITLANPAPVCLNFEKVYMPCMFVAKKRYVGHRYDAREQAQAVLDAKGLEIVRRDGHAVLQRMQATVVRLLFETNDLSAVKRYCQRQWAKLYAGHVSALSLVIAKTVRIGTYASLASLPPGAALAMQRMLRDPGFVPHPGERIPYLIKAGPPGAKLQDLAFSPSELGTQNVPLHMDYYIRRTILPALDRILALVGVDVHAWLDKMPRVTPKPATWAAVHTCVACGHLSSSFVCIDCLRNPESAMYALVHRQRAAEQRQLQLHELCTSCAGTSERPPCAATDCAAFYARAQNDRQVRGLAQHPMQLEHALHEHKTMPTSDAWMW